MLDVSVFSDLLPNILYQNFLRHNQMSWRYRQVLLQPFTLFIVHYIFLRDQIITKLYFTSKILFKIFLSCDILIYLQVKIIHHKIALFTFILTGKISYLQLDKIR